MQEALEVGEVVPERNGERDENHRDHERPGSRASIVLHELPGRVSEAEQDGGRNEKAVEPYDAQRNLLKAGCESN